MKTWCIVAIPEDDDPVWKMSSEKVPHMTLLFLGEQTDVEKASHIAQQLQHTANTSLSSFSAFVHTRGVLGDDNADVLFFDQAQIPQSLINFRSLLLKDNTIRACYDSAFQYPNWTPHLTMGYPKSPARKAPSSFVFDSPRSVHFNRVALWVGDSDGPTFDLDLWDSMPPTDLMMSGLFTSKRHVGAYSPPATKDRKGMFVDMNPSGLGLAPSNLKHHGIGAKKFDHKDPIAEALPKVVSKTLRSSEEIELETENLRHTYSGVRHKEMLDPQNKYVRMNQLAFIENLQHALGGRPSETAHRRFDICSRPDGDWLLSSIDTLTHSGVVESRIHPVTNSVGLYTDFQIHPESPDQGDIGLALKHYGVKGMKWGVRRKRQADGTVGGGPAEPTKRQKKKADKKAVKQQKKVNKKQDRKDAWTRPVSTDAQTRTRSRAKKHGTDALSDAELKKLVSRMQTEVQYASLVENKKGIKARANGQAYAKDLLKDFGKQVASEAGKYAFEEAVKKTRDNRSNSTYTPSTRVGQNQLPRGRRAISR